MKKAWVRSFGALILLVSLLAGFTLRRTAAAEVNGINSNEDRLAFLESIGRRAESTPLSARYVTLPEELSPVLEAYNRLQLAQGFDLRPYCGKELEQYSYKAAEDYLGETLYYTLYVYRGRIVGADAHTASLNGAMMGLLRTEEN